MEFKIILLFLMLVYPINAYCSDNDEHVNIEINCRHTRDYRDKRTDPDWVEKLFNYGSDSTLDPMNYDINGNYNPDLLTSIIGTVGLVAKIEKKQYSL